ncbi:vegetative cell wall protein gp1-like [Cryptomeria japonica]|uniref:vegetative cell wall protein gp1-like n=1 Tax=Cryptomeria japonica TaxID=3369 RepID=UPI0027DAA60F|nr:vegetative cell wall protein gp1-like [Cryptomeria japonica]
MGPLPAPQLCLFAVPLTGLQPPCHLPRTADLLAYGPATPALPVAPTAIAPLPGHRLQRRPAPRPPPATLPRSPITSCSSSPPSKLLLTTRAPLGCHRCAAHSPPPPARATRLPFLPLSGGAPWGPCHVVDPAGLYSTAGDFSSGPQAQPGSGHLHHRSPASGLPTACHRPSRLWFSSSRAAYGPRHRRSAPRPPPAVPPRSPTAACNTASLPGRHLQLLPTTGTPPDHWSSTRLPPVRRSLATSAR